MTRLAQVFWSVAAVDAVLLLVLLSMTLQQGGGQHDGGREMGLFFFIVVPGVVLALAALSFHFSAWLPVRGAALFVVLVPGLWFAVAQARELVLDRQVAADRAGTGYFDSEPMRRMGAAVVARDVATLERIAPPST